MKRIWLVIISVILLAGVCWAADKPVSQLPATETIEDEDLLLVSKYDAGNYFSRHITFANLKKKLDELYQAIGGGGGGGYTNLTQFKEQTPWRLFYSDGSGDVKELAFGGNGQYLKSNGAAVAPSWDAPAVGGDFNEAGNYTPTGDWDWSGVGLGSKWPTFNQDTTGNATTATDLKDYGNLYTGTVTGGALLKYDAATKKLTDGLKLGTLSNTKMCVYSSSDGLVCNSDIPSAGIALSDVYSDAITDGALPKYNSLTQKLSEGLKLGTLTSGKWCTYTTEYGLVCNSDTPSGGGIAVEDIYEGTIADGDLTAYDNTSGKLKSAGAAVAYTPPALKAPLCGAEGAGVGACANLTDTVIPATGTMTGGKWCTFIENVGIVCDSDAPQGGGNGIEYTPPEDPAPLCSDITGAIVACVNLKDEDLAEIEGSSDDLGVKIVTISEDPEAVIECEGKDRTYIVDVEADLIFQLPADPSGRRYCFGNNDYATKISIVPDGTDTIRHAGDVTDSEGDNGLVSTGDESEFICLLGLSSSKWRTISYLGTWTIDEVELPSEPEEPPPTGDCTTPTGNVVTESFGDDSTLCWTDGPSTCNNTWTVVGGTPAIAAVPEGAPENTACDNGLNLVRTDESVYLRHDLGVGSITNKDVDINFSLYINSSTLPAWNRVLIAALNDTPAPMIGGNSDFNFSLYRYTGSAGPANAIIVHSVSDDSSCFLEGIVEDTWYDVTISLDGANGTDASSLSIGTGAGQSCSFTGRTTNGRYLWFGIHSEVADFYVGNARVSASGGE